jgi:nucleoside-diphosphate-sugar epimerase
MAPVHDAARPGDVKRSWADISLAQMVLGCTPTVGFEEGLRQTIASYEESARPDRTSTIGGARR